MTAEILQHNHKVVYHSTYCPLTAEECATPAVQQDMATFRETTKEHLGARLTLTELKEVSISDTPENVLYTNEDQNETTFPDLDEEVMPELGNEYYTHQ